VAKKKISKTCLSADRSLASVCYSKATGFHFLNNRYFYTYSHDTMSEKPTLAEATLKLEYYCSYQERCHQEVVDKLYQLGMKSDEIDGIVVHLLQHNFLNEERFARSFARGKHRIKSWGKIRIVNELKQRHISAPNIKAALTEITEEAYQDTFHQLAERYWNSLTERNGQKKNKKFCDYLLRRGWESQLVYEKMKELEKL
jgi:regulatory protein